METENTRLKLSRTSNLGCNNISTLMESVACESLPQISPESLGRAKTGRSTTPGNFAGYGERGKGARNLISEYEDDV
jgi:hypothetical protein